MSEKKSKKLYLKLIGGFVLVELGLIFTLIFSQVVLGKFMNSGNAQQYIRYYNIGISVVFLLLFAVMFYLSITLPKQLRKGMESVSTITRKIAEGDIEVELKKYKEDEFGGLVDEYSGVIESTKYLAKMTNMVSEGDLTVQVTPRSPKDVLGLSLKKLVERNHHALSNINDAAYQVMTSASQVASASESLAQGSTEQASAIEEITASITEIAQKTKQNASQANDVSELMKAALEDVKKGNVDMQDMVVAMEEINRASESISKIIKVIDDIAFQTNILALNAAVEAARAGEAGKGFAVVAEEVRNLAAKSSAAAAETAELIEDSMRKVAVGTRIADETSAALEKITTDVEQSEGMIREIAESSNYQATAVAQINQAIGQVSQVVQTNSATSEECAAAAEELSNQAVRMRTLLSVYRLETTSAGFGGEPAPMTIPAPEKTMNLPMAENDNNEQIISLGEDFGKY